MQSELLETLRQAQQGDPVALDYLLYLQFDPLVAFVNGRLSPEARNAQLAEDIVQEAMVTIAQQITEFVIPAGADGASQLFNWMAGIAHNRLLQTQRGRSARRRGGDKETISAVADAAGEMVQILALLSAHSGTPSRKLAGREAIEAMERALQSLDEDYRAVLELRYLKELPVPEVAARLNRSEYAVRMLISRALRHLRSRLDRSHFLSSNG